MKTLSNTPSCQVFGLLTLFSFSAAALAGSKPFKPIGVKAWTSGSETFIRARPSADVPPVAKVARHTPLYVWGKYNGWYRVETHDHIFGWVLNPYINAPKVFKVREMPHSKARVASNRTANQTMYGTPEVLKKHFATYGASGALDGLKKHGIYVVNAPRPKTAPAKPRLAATTRPVAPKLRPRLAAALRPDEKVTVGKVTVGKVTIGKVPVKAASPVPNIEKPRLAVRLAPSNPPRVATAPLRPRVEPVPNPAFGPDDTTPALIAPSSVAPSSVAPNSMESNSMAPRAVEASKIAGASRDLVPSARQFARAAGDAASQPATPLLSTPAMAFAPAFAPASPPVAGAPAPRAAAVVPAPRTVVKPRLAVKAAPVKKVKKPIAKAAPRSRYATRKAHQRDQLRLKMGLSPAPMPPTIIAPVSPADLLKAREQYLNERKARLNGPATQNTVPNGPQIETPVGNLAPLPPPTGPLGGPTNGNLPPAPPALEPMAYNRELDLSLPPLYPILADPRVVALSQIKPPALVPGAGLTPLYPQKFASLASRGTALSGTALRGGSPRDRFGSGMANQALSYRGMRYIRGAASPNRGFDCSGLVYYLLRQRGYNPPRTAAGYRNWGQSVPRGAWQPGDLVLFSNTYKRGISHIGVYLGQNKFVHAANSGTGVRVSSLNEAYYRSKYFGARRAVK